MSMVSLEYVLFCCRELNEDKHLDNDRIPDGLWTVGFKFCNNCNMKRLVVPTKDNKTAAETQIQAFWF